MGPEKRQFEAHKWVAWNEPGRRRPRGRNRALGESGLLSAGVAPTVPAFSLLADLGRSRSRPYQPSAATHNRVPSGAGYSYETIPGQGRAGWCGGGLGRARRSEAESLDWYGTLSIPAREGRHSCTRASGLGVRARVIRTDQ